MGREQLGVGGKVEGGAVPWCVVVLARMLGDAVGTAAAAHGTTAAAPSTAVLEGALAALSAQGAAAETVRIGDLPEGVSA